MRLGTIRPKLEAMVGAHGATLVVPLLDRGTLVGLVEADHGDALRDEERNLVVESSHAAARALTYASLARAAAKEGANAGEVEVAEAMRLQAAASRDDELGRWTVAAEYRAATKTTGAGWSAALLADGRLALMKADGVAAAATTGSAPVELDDLLASRKGVMRGSEPISANRGSNVPSPRPRRTSRWKGTVVTSCRRTTRSRLPSTSRSTKTTPNTCPHALDVEGRRCLSRGTPVPLRRSWAACV